MSFLEQLEWRHATKSFDSSKKVREEDLKKILNAVRMTPTSYGLSPFYVKVITDTQTKEKLFPVSYNQVQVKEASHVLAFVARNDVLKRIDEYFTGVTGGSAEKRAGLAGYENMMKGSFQGKTPEQMTIWAQKQIYIALGFAMAACAELEVDSCPMEGFLPDAVDQILGLSEIERSTVLLPIGYRNPANPARPKFRMPESDLIRR